MNTNLLTGLAQPLIRRLQRRCSQPGRCPVLALQAPVGAGKSTLARQLQDLAATVGLRLAVASIDDAYHGWEERQRRLAGNPFGVNRVPPGSHDPDLLVAAITAWRKGGPLTLPRFDKNLRHGQGDRSGWQRCSNADALLLEGWLVGYEPVGQARLSRWLADHPDELNPAEQAWLPHWDQALAAYQTLWQCCDSFWMLQPERASSVLRWRLQAEARQRRSGGDSLTTQEIQALVRASQASLPAGLYGPALEARAMAIARLDGRRQCRQVTLNQASLSSSLMG
jgi:D-glycerate 3-kinase